MGFILLSWEHQRAQSPGRGCRDSKERSQALPGIGVLLGSWASVAGGWAGMGGTGNFSEGTPWGVSNQVDDTSIGRGANCFLPFQSMALYCVG